MPISSIQQRYTFLCVFKNKKYTDSRSINIYQLLFIYYTFVNYLFLKYSPMSNAYCIYLFTLKRFI